MFPGCVLGVVTPNAEPEIIALGRFTYDIDAPKMQTDSVFDVASVTKAIPVSSLALQLIDKGDLRLDDRLIRYVPKFNNSSRERVLIRHLLTHTLNYNFRLSSYKNSADEVLNAILSSEFTHEPGASFFYSNATSILLGMVIEKVYNDCLATIAKRELFDPLGMSESSFFAEDFDKKRIVPTEIDPWRNRVICGEVHDESAWVLRSKMIAGSAGLFTTVPDILKFLKMLLGKGMVQGRRYFSETILEQMQSNQISCLNLQTGLGWELFQKRYMGENCTEHTIGKTGFTGCVCVCDIQRQKAFALLSNYTFPHRKPDSKAMDCVRHDIADILWNE